MKSLIVRLEESDEGTIGTMVIDGRVFCTTMEPPWKENVEDVSCIPTGVYICKPHKSKKYDTFEVMDVAHRSAILFHAGNEVENTKGCILLGRNAVVLRSVDRFIENTGATFKQFMGLVKSKEVKEFELEVIELMMN